MQSYIFAGEAADLAGDARCRIQTALEFLVQRQHAVRLCSQLAIYGFAVRNDMEAAIAEQSPVLLWRADQHGCVGCRLLKVVGTLIPAANVNNAADQVKKIVDVGNFVVAGGDPDLAAFADAIERIADGSARIARIVATALVHAIRCDEQGFFEFAVRAGETGKCNGREKSQNLLTASRHNHYSELDSKNCTLTTMIRRTQSHKSLQFHAGPGAYREVREHGFSAQRVGTFAGASGGAKWLVLSQLDRVVARRILPLLREPVHLVATSIGAWRFACYAQRNPIAAIDRFEAAYLSQSYSESPDRQEITQRSAEILDCVLGERGVSEVLSHPVLRTHVITVRSRHVLALENRFALSLALASAATLNVLSRRTLGGFFERALFYDERDVPRFLERSEFPLHRIPLSEANLRDVILATGSIPLVLSGVRDIAGAPAGVYRDGGVIDYHLDFPHSGPDRLAVYLHFYNFIKPGWFDKRLPWRMARPASVDRTILISPSPEFVQRLPYAKIPDRRDFLNFSPADRERCWRSVVNACQELADEFEDVLDNDRMAERIQPF